MVCVNKELMNINDVKNVCSWLTLFLFLLLLEMNFNVY